MTAFPIAQHTLANGLRVVLAPDSTIPVVAVNLWYGVGSRNEPEGLTGFAHLFEHMMFQGSENVAKNGHFEMIERAGGSVNASTWFDRTNYFETVPSHHLELALWLEADRLGALLPAMTQEKLDNQKGVVTNEKRERYDNQPYGDWDERMLRLVFPSEHPYHHTVIGSMEDIEAATLDDIASFFSTFYRPNNAVLTLAGDFAEPDALVLIDRHFGPLERGAPIPSIPGKPELRSRIGATVYETVEADVPFSRIYIGFRVPVSGESGHDDARVGAAVLGSGRASRLYERLVREQKVAKDVGCFVYPLTTGSAFMVLWGTCYPGADPEVLTAALYAELDGLGDVTSTEVERAIAISETQVARQLEGLAARADLLSSGEMLFSDPGRIHTELDRVRSVDAKRVRRFAARHLGADNRAVITYVPEDKS